MSVTRQYRRSGELSPELKEFKRGIQEYEQNGMNGPPPWSIDAPRPKIPEGVKVSHFTLNGLDCMKTTAGTPSKKAVYYIHGGGMMAGSVEDCLLILPEITARSGIDGYSIEYTLVPHAQYPTQIEQCVEMYKWLLAQGYEQIAVTGVSAGANLSLAVTMRCRELGLPMPVSVASMSAGLDSSGTIIPKRPDFLSADIGSGIFDAYLGETDPKTPDVSPLFADFNGFPPTLFQVGESESMQDAHLALIDRLEREGVDAAIEFSLWQDMGHGFALEGGYYPEGYTGRDQVIDFLLGHFR